MSSRRDVVRIHRLEHPFPIHYLCHAAFGACYAVDEVRQLCDAPVLLAVIANLLAIVGGNPLNAVVDIPSDAHTGGKRDIAVAAHRIGRKRALTWAGAEMTSALVAATAVGLWLDRPLIAIGVTLSVALCLLYNLEPARLKRRGLVNPLVIGLTLGTLPSLVSYSAVRPDLTTSVWLIFIGLGTLLIGRTLWWTIPDHPGDRAAGISTPAVRYGPFQTLVLACAVTATGLILLGSGLVMRYGPPWALLGLLISGIFLVKKLSLLRRLSDNTPPDPTRMRRRDLISVTATDVTLALLPIAAHRA